MISTGTEAAVLQVSGRGVAYQVELEGPYEAPEAVPAAVLKIKTCPGSLTRNSAGSFVPAIRALN